MKSYLALPPHTRPSRFPVRFLLYFAVLFPLLASSPLLALEMDRNEYRERREALAESLRGEMNPGDSAVFILPASPWAEELTYRQGSNFYYLTGVEVPGSTLVLMFERPRKEGKRPKGAKGKATPAPPYAEYLYLPGRDHGAERWTGEKLGAGGVDSKTLEPDADRRAAMEASGFDRMPEGDYPSRWFPRIPVQDQGDLGGHLELFLSSSTTLFHPIPRTGLEEPLGAELNFLKKVRERFPLLTLKTPDAALARLRAVKSPSELASLRRAIEITCRSHQDAMASVQPGVPEYEIQATIEYRFTAEGARRPGFPSIVASGPNTCVLHYDANDRIMEEGDLLLMDIGAEYQRYSADVTRTIPVSGRFTPRQREIYEIVLKAQKAAIEVIKPGIPFRKVHQTARKVIEEAGYGDHFWHGTSHYLGLDVHDVGERDAKLQAGMVLTVEPGIYLPDENLGVRIEDDILVTDRGSEWLSRCVPRDPDAVEMQMSGGLKSGAH